MEAVLSHLEAQQQAAAAALARASGGRPVAGALLDAADASIVATDGGGAVTLCNAAAAQLLESKAGRLIGRPIQEVFTQGEVLRLLDGAIAGRPAQAEVRMPIAGGMHTLDVSAAPVPGGGAVIVFRDVTELARAVQVKSDFVANASHELRTPITALRMAVETLGAGADQDPVMRARLLETIAGNTARL